MDTLQVALAERSYPIHVGSGLLARAELILPHLPQPRAVIVTNPTVGALYLERLTAVLEHAGVGTVAVSVPDGEAYKNWETLNPILDVLLTDRCERGAG
jgi:3-dehydroquinate synthase